MDCSRLLRSAFPGFSDDLIAKKIRQTKKSGVWGDKKEEKDDVNERGAASAAGDVRSGRDCGGR